LKYANNIHDDACIQFLREEVDKKMWIKSAIERALGTDNWQHIIDL
jgi:hypothetical protein